MNARCPDRQFTPLEVAMIESQQGFENRHREDKSINYKSRIGKHILNQRIANLVNSALQPKVPISAEHIQLYKRCWADEFSDRTGKCAFGFPEVRLRYGYDPVTGQEVI
jgi:hypothetical protein